MPSDGGYVGTLAVVTCSISPPIGVWQNISPQEFTTPSDLETVAVGVDVRSGAVYAAASDKTVPNNILNGATGVMTSTDCGASFHLASTGTNSDVLKTGDPWAIVVTVDGIIFINNGYGDHPTLYRSTNSGKDFEALNVNPDGSASDFVQHVAVDPTDPKHLLVRFHELCASPHTVVCLSETYDTGDHWRVIDGPPELTGFNEGGDLAVLDHDTYFFTGDNGADLRVNGTWQRVLSGATHGAAYIASDGRLYLGVVSDALYVSSSNPLGATWQRLPGSPGATTLIDDGTTLYASNYEQYGGQPLFSASIHDVTMPSTQWQNAPQSVARGATHFAYDPIHHYVYGSNLGGGLWRLRVQ
jgi:hypothetical protein